jgi:DNA-binding NarL/FixJ family response regulator
MSAMSNLSRRGRPPHPDVLTPGEWRTVHAIRHGMSGRLIALRRGVSKDAVKYHVRNILAKLGLEDREALRHWPGVPADSALHDRGRTNAMNDALSLLHLFVISLV